MAIRFYAATDDTVKLYASYLNANQFPFTRAFSGNRLPVEFGLLERNIGSVASTWSIKASSSYTLEIGLYNGGTQLSFANTFTNLDTNHKTGTLLLDTAAINSALTSVSSLTCSLEIQVTYTGGEPLTVHRNDSFLLVKKLITAGAVSNIPGETTATQEWVKAIFVPRDGTATNTPCDHFLMTTPSGKKVLVRISDDLQLDITSYS